MSKLHQMLFEYGSSDEEIESLISEATPTLTLPKVHQFYTTYSRPGYFREDVIRALNDAGIRYQERE